MKIILLCLFSMFLNTSNAFAQNKILQGVVLDETTKMPLAFVNIIVVENRMGTITDIDGKFLLPTTLQKYTLKFSLVGYKTKVLEITENVTTVSVTLKTADKQLETVIVSNAKNPAHRIIKLVQQNKKKNNPNSITSYKYNAYTISTLAMGNALFVTPQNDTVNKQKQKIAIKLKKPVDTTQSKRDSIAKATLTKLLNNYVMVTEAYTQNIFRYPNKIKETVIATKVSGFKNAPFALTTSNFQRFGFYNDYVQFGIENYVSPLINGSLAFYKFTLEEAIKNESDTTFIISFEPKANKNFKALKGILYINSDGYAIENVTTSPATLKGVSLQFKLQQQYKKQQGQWFPTQLNTNVKQVSLSNDSVLFNWDSRSYISNAIFGERYPNYLFSDVQKEFDIAAGKKLNSEWQVWRADTLSEKEKVTYKTYDELPPKTLNKIDNLNKLVTIIALRAIPWGKVDVLLKYFFAGINRYERFRLGGGVQTNTNFSKLISVGCFIGYGIGDKAWKYGANTFVTLKERTASKLTFNYEQNLQEPGLVDYVAQNNSVLFAQPIRKFTAFRMDSVQQFKVDFTTKIVPTLQTNIWLKNEKRNPSEYDYNFVSNANTLVRNFNTTELGIAVRYTNGESFLRIGRAKVAAALPRTQLLVSATKGIKQLFNGGYDFTKIGIQYNKLLKSKWLGETAIQIDAGKIWGSMPYPFLFNTNGSIGQRETYIYNPNSFQTVGIYEFNSSQSASIFLQHDFGNLLFKPKNTSFRPSFLITQAISFGQLNNTNNHKGIVVQSPNKGLYESGIYVKNIYRRTFNNQNYVGIGAGVFYRYGYYSLPKTINNVAFKFGLHSSF